MRPIGWRFESYRHSLAARGVETGRRRYMAHRYFKDMPVTEIPMLQYQLGVQQWAQEARDRPKVHTGRGRPAMELDRAAIRRMRAEGMTVRKIALEMGVSEPTILKFLASEPGYVPYKYGYKRGAPVAEFTEVPEYSIRGRPRLLSDEDVERMVRLREEGWSLEDIADTMGVPKSTMLLALRRSSSYTPLKRGRKPLAIELSAEPEMVAAPEMIQPRSRGLLGFMKR